MSWAGVCTASQRRNVSGLWQSETVRLSDSPKETLGGEKESYTQQQPPSYLQFLPVSTSALQLVPRSSSHGRREGAEHLPPTRTLPTTPHTHQPHENYRLRLVIVFRGGRKTDQERTAKVTNVKGYKQKT